MRLTNTYPKQCIATHFVINEHTENANLFCASYEIGILLDSAFILVYEICSVHDLKPLQFLRNKGLKNHIPYFTFVVIYLCFYSFCIKGWYPRISIKNECALIGMQLWFVLLFFALTRFHSQSSCPTRYKLTIWYSHMCR